MEGLRVKCPKCKRTGTYVTTAKYDPDKTPNGSMLRLRNLKYKGGLTYGTCTGSPPVPANLMECCDCGGMLTFGGKIIVVDDIKQESEQEQIIPEVVEDIQSGHVCDECGQVCKTGIALHNHKKFKHGSKP